MRRVLGLNDESASKDNLESKEISSYEDTKSDEVDADESDEDTQMSYFAKLAAERPSVNPSAIKYSN